MARPLHVDLSKEQRNELIDVRDHYDKPYMRTTSPTCERKPPPF
jgi:hypothetical protein